MTPYQISSEIYGGFYYPGITLIYSMDVLFISSLSLKARLMGLPLPLYLSTGNIVLFDGTEKKEEVDYPFTFLFFKNVVFPAQGEYSYFSADFRLKIFLYYS